jgi:3-deoxy-D-manno-octulosonate 8-phosphate phosphatase (KDO 8-P phosphatase)
MGSKMSDQDRGERGQDLLLRDADGYRREMRDRFGAELADRLAAVRGLVLDADGVLTSGHLYYGPEGEVAKSFHSRDGLGLVLARAAGLKLAVLTGRGGQIVATRSRELQFDAVHIGRYDKLAALDEICRQLGVSAEHLLYVGDDLLDLPPMLAVGVAVGVPAAPPEVRERCHLVTRCQGGEGAVREVIELVLKAQGMLGIALARIMQRPPAFGREGRP